MHTARNLRRLLLGATATALVALTACGSGSADPSGSPSAEPSTSASASPSASPTPTTTITPSADLSDVSVSDADVPVVKVPAPWGIATTQTEVLRESTGSQVLAEDSTVTVNYVGYNGTDPFGGPTRAPLDVLAADPKMDFPKGELVVLVGPGREEAATAADADTALADALTRLKPADAAAEVAKALGLSRRDLYRRAMELKQK